MFSSFSYIRYDVTRVHNGVGWTRSSFTTCIFFWSSSGCAGIARAWWALWGKKKILVRVRIPVGENFFWFWRLENFFSGRGEYEKMDQKALWLLFCGWEPVGDLLKRDRSSPAWNPLKNIVYWVGIFFAVVRKITIHSVSVVWLCIFFVWFYRSC